jgi:hypothetical protein
LSSRLEKKNRTFGCEWLLRAIADAGENSVYDRLADKDETALAVLALVAGDAR